MTHWEEKQDEIYRAPYILSRFFSDTYINVCIFSTYTHYCNCYFYLFGSVSTMYTIAKAHILSLLFEYVCIYGMYRV